jgi:hypothetical protein
MNTILNNLKLYNLIYSNADNLYLKLSNIPHTNFIPISLNNVIYSGISSNIFDIYTRGIDMYYITDCYMM